jgi:hypothetical protein
VIFETWEMVSLAASTCVGNPDYNMDRDRAIMAERFSISLHYGALQLFRPCAVCGIKDKPDRNGGHPIASMNVRCITIYTYKPTPYLYMDIKTKRCGTRKSVPR